MWHSKQDVLNDLPGYSRLYSDFDDSHIVRGSEPPPVTRHEDDIDLEELQARYGEGYNGSSLNCQPTDPDLCAITESLRMVDTFDKPESHTTQTEVGTNSTLIIISKLNPDVNEFVPTTKASSTGQQVTDTVIDRVTQNSDTGKTPTEETHNCVKLDEAKNIKLEVDVKELEQQLKNKICSKTKPATLTQKRERNVAIAALMRLKTTATPPKSPSSTPKCSSPQLKLDSPKKLAMDEKPDSSKFTIPQEHLHLLTPKYFEGPSAKIVDVDNNVLIPEPEPLFEPPKTSQSPREILDPQMKDSIEKVNKWLNPPEKVKSCPSGPHIGAVCFRKKDTPSVTPTSINSECNKPTEAENKPTPPAEFIPSSYAEQLKKKFEERVRANEELARKIETPCDRLIQPLKEIGLSFTFKRTSNENGHEL